MTTYTDFLARKIAAAPQEGITVQADDLHPFLHDWQAEIVAWALKVGRAAIWADTGLGKTVMQIEWARQVGGTVLIVAPLAVCAQTVREARKVDVNAVYVRDGTQVTGPGVWVTNYEMVEHFDPATLDGVVLDEASILKQSNGKTRTLLIRHFADVPHRLSCTATPAPNDPEELTNQAEFLGHSTRVNMLAAYFVHDQDGWRLKGHARRPMLRWMATWALAVRTPSDLGHPDTGYVLPGLEVVPQVVESDIEPEGQLFATDLGGVGGRAKVRRETLNARLGREDADERHIAPLQLEFIRRCVLLYSNPGELVLSPFGGIGSEPYVAVKNGRRAVSCELKPSYWQAAVGIMRDLEHDMNLPTLFDQDEVLA